MCDNMSPGAHNGPMMVNERSPSLVHYALLMSRIHGSVILFNSGDKRDQMARL